MIKLSGKLTEKKALKGNISVGSGGGYDDTEIRGVIEEIKRNLPSYSIPNIAVFDKQNIKRGYVITLPGGRLDYVGDEYGNAVIDEFINIDPDGKYEVLVYHAEEVYISEYDQYGSFRGQSKLTNGYRLSYDYAGNSQGGGATYNYTSPVAFSFFSTNFLTDKIKISFKSSSYTTDPRYFPNSSSLMIDNAINSIKIVKVGTRE